MSKTLDFDLFMQEKEGRTMDVVVFGDTYQIPMEIPAIVPIMMARAEESMNPADSTRMIMRAADSLFGVENVNAMCKKGLTAKQLVAMIEKIFAEINGGGEDEEAEELTDEDSRVQTRSRRSKK